MTTRTCPLCAARTASDWCCGIHLAEPFAMTARRVNALRRYAHGRKGLDGDTYRLHLAAVGAASTKNLTREQYHGLLARLNALPDRPRRAAEPVPC